MARAGGFRTNEGAGFAEFDGLLDAAPTGPRWLEFPEVAGIVAECLLAGERERRYELRAWVLMPNHLHAALCPLGDQDLAAAVRSVRESSAMAANRFLKRTGAPFWARDSFDRRIRDREHEGRVRSYIENSPVKAGLCAAAEDWLWSSAHKRG
jgi:REP element-mobilizing transposase RayT